MNQEPTQTFALDNFEGPLDFLLHLVQKKEIDISDISVQQLTEQFLSRLHERAHPPVDEGAEFIGTAASLLWMKSKMLLPKHEQLEGEEEEEDPSFEIIHKLVEYCRFKEISKALLEREEQQNSYFPRGLPPLDINEVEKSQSIGIEHLTLQDLADLLQRALLKASTRKETIHEDLWRISDKIAYMQTTLDQERRIKIETLFPENRPHLELIVTFLAILELMKLGEARVTKDDETLYLTRGCDD